MDSICEACGVRPHVQGKFIFVEAEKFYVCGVTYGTFRRDEDGHEIYDPQVVEQDFAMMAANGINAIRTYTVPPRWLLDAAQQHRLYVETIQNRVLVLPLSHF